MAARWKSWVLLVVVGLHLWGGVALYDYRPDGLAPRLLPRAQLRNSEVLMVLSFPAPRSTARDRISSPAVRRLRRSAQSSVQSTAMVDGSAFDGPSSPAPPAASLDLRLPQEATVDPPHDTFLQHRPALEFQRTRYDGAWVGQGNLTHVVARRSKIAGVLLSVVGALVVPCTEADRARYKRGCVSDQYEHKPEADVD